MASTNHTTNYDLSQYSANDKPTYLVDYNGDMLKIDTGIHNAQSEAATNTTSIGTLSSLNTTEKSNLVGAINEVNTQVGTNTGNISTLNTSVSANTGNIGTMANLDTSDKTSLVNAVNEVNGKFNNFNLTNIQTIQYTDMTVTGGTLTRGTITIAKNSDDSIIKVYGNLHGLFTSNIVTITIPCLLSVDTGYDIFPAGMTALNSTDGQKTFINGQTLTLANNQLTCGFGGINGYEYELLLFPCLYFNKDFGDQPNA